jgi:hypothetical protein
MASAKTRFLALVMHRTVRCPHFVGAGCDITLQAGWTVFIIEAIKRINDGAAIA